MLASIDRRAALAGIAVSLLPIRAARAQAPSLSGPVELVARPAPGKLFAGAATAADTWAFAGHDGPALLRIRHGDEVVATLRNETTRPLTLHWHGVRGPAATDGTGGVSQPAVQPGASFTYRFTPPDSGTYLIRSLVPGAAGEAAGRGLAGALIVDERDPPRVDGDHALVVRDWLVEPSGALGPFGRPEEAALAGRLGNRIAVGSGDAPRRLEVAPGARLRLRLLNACNARIMRVRFDGMKAFVAAVDGQPTDTFEPLKASLPFAPGTRYDIVFDMPREPGAKAVVVAQIGQGVPLVEIATSQAAPVPDRDPIAALPQNKLLPPEVRLQNAVRRDLTISGGATRDEAGRVGYSGDPTKIWRIDGAAGTPGGRPAFTARRGQPVVLGLVNTTGFVQPMHLHGYAFRLLHNLDDGWEPYWLDTLQVAEGKTARIAFVADNPGKWVISSTVLERFDTGLWTWFEVS